MRYTDDDHETARIIKDLEERINNLEESSKSSPTPSLLRTFTDSVSVGAPPPPSLRARSVDPMIYDDTGDSGWDISSRED